jgi:hypothetical protein
MSAARASGSISFVVHAAPGAIAVETVPHVEVLLEVVTQWHVQERAVARGELHRGCQTALNDGQIAFTATSPP